MGAGRGEVTRELPNVEDLGGEGLSLSAMAAYQSARLLPSWENAAFRICVQVARVGAAASPGSVTSRLLEGHVTERWCNESS